MPCMDHKERKICCGKITKQIFIQITFDFGLFGFASVPRIRKLLRAFRKLSSPSMFPGCQASKRESNLQIEIMRVIILRLELKVLLIFSRILHTSPCKSRHHYCCLRDREAELPG